MGSALLVILIAAVLANLGVIPTYSSGDALYNGIFNVVAPLGVFFLLLGVRLVDLRRAGALMIGLFLLGSAGTVIGVVTSYLAVGGAEAFGERAAALGGMFIGTYTGGSANFNAVALAYDVQQEGLLFAGANAVDALMTTVWMIVTLVVPPLMRPRRPAAAEGTPDPAATEGSSDQVSDEERIEPGAVALLVAMGAIVLAASHALPTLFNGQWMLVLTTSALLLAQLRFVAAIPGKRVLGMSALLLFLAVIGALCDLRALASLGELGGTLFVFVSLAIVIHGVVVFGVARVFRLDPDAAAVASQANIGGGTTALALARGLGRPDLVLPAVLIGSLGTALGTYLGIAAVRLLE